MFPWDHPDGSTQPEVPMLAHQPSAIERIVEAIKGYFSIVGLLLAGLYLLHSPFRSTRLLTWLSYAGGCTAVFCGTVVCVWYSAFLLRTLLISDDFHQHSRPKKALFWGLLALAVVILASIILGAITMTCDLALS